MWGGALVRGAEFRQIHLYGKNFKSTPAHQTEPLRMARAPRTAQTTKSLPGGLTLYMPTEKARQVPRSAYPIHPKSKNLTKSKPKPPDRLTLHLPYTCPHQMHPGNPIDLPRARAPQNRGPPSPPIGLPYTYPIHARTNRPALRPRSAYPIHARTANGHNTRPAPPGGGMHRMWARWREWQQR